MRRLALIAAFSALAGAAFAQSGPAELAMAAAQKLRDAHTALENATGARDRVTALTQTIRAYEDGLNALRDGMRRATLREAVIRKEFEAESKKVSQLVGVLLSMQSAAGPLVLLHPSGPLGTARSGMILADVTPAVQQQAEALRIKLDELKVLRALQESSAQTLEVGLKGVQEARTELSQAISDRTDLPRQFLSDPSQVQRLIDSTETLDGFATGLATLNVGQALAPDLPEFAASKGTLELPVSGTVLRRYLEPDAAGVKRPGMLIATRPLALVSTPFPGTIRYVGPLLDYGNVMILEPAADTLLVLAGMDQVYGEVGQVLAGGSAVGLMGGTETGPDTFLLNAANGSGSGQTETLYIELRLGGKPADPVSWFAETKE